MKTISFPMCVPLQDSFIHSKTGMSINVWLFIWCSCLQPVTLLNGSNSIRHLLLPQHGNSTGTKLETYQLSHVLSRKVWAFQILHFCSLLWKKASTLINEPITPSLCTRAHPLRPNLSKLVQRCTLVCGTLVVQECLDQLCELVCVTWTKSHFYRQYIMSLFYLFLYLFSVDEG